MKNQINKWAKLREQFNLEDKQLSEAFVMPLRVAIEPYLRSFQYKVLNSILYTNELFLFYFILFYLFATHNKIHNKQEC